MRCDIRSCRRPARWYVDKTKQDLCEEHGDQWTEDEKIPIQTQPVNTEDNNA